MSHGEPSLQLNEVSSLPADPLGSLISSRLREELQQFACQALREELGDLRSQMRSDIRQELKDSFLEHRELHDVFHEPRDGGLSYHLQGSLGGKQTPAPKESWVNKLVHTGVSRTSLEAQRTQRRTPRSVFQQFKSAMDFSQKKSSELSTGVASDDSELSEVVPRFGRKKIKSQMTAALTRGKTGLIALEAQGRKSKSKKKTRGLRSEMTGKALTNLVKARPDSRCSQACHAIGSFVEHTISVFIFLNGVFIGVQTDYQARKMTEDVPRIFPVVEILFCAIFTTELLLKLCAYRLKFFIDRNNWMWNVFDTFLVIIQLLEVIGMLTANHESSGGGPVQNVSFLRLLRILRLFRVLRLVRLLHFVGELATIVSSIANSFRALCWTMVLLMLMIYMVGIFYTQIVFSHRVGLSDGRLMTGGNLELARWWGSLGRSVLSLYQAILGGVDWQEVVQPLHDEISPFMSLTFSFYIAFALLAMMNIITGTFVQSALKNAENEQAQDFVTAARDVFASFEGLITKEQFDSQIDDDSFKTYIKNIGIDPKDAKLLFRLLDSNQSDSIELEMLIAGMVRLREGAKFMDILKLMNETERTGRKVDETCSHLEDKMPRMCSTVTEQILQQVVNGGRDTSCTSFCANPKQVEKSPQAVDVTVDQGVLNGSGAGVTKTVLVEIQPSSPQSLRGSSVHCLESSILIEDM